MRGFQFQFPNKENLLKVEMAFSFIFPSSLFHDSIAINRERICSFELSIKGGITLAKCTVTPQVMSSFPQDHLPPGPRRPAHHHRRRHPDLRPRPRPRPRGRQEEGRLPLLLLLQRRGGRPDREQQRQQRTTAPGTKEPLAKEPQAQVREEVQQEVPDGARGEQGREGQEGEEGEQGLRGQQRW